jgi:hypothetical protein
VKASLRGVLLTAAALTLVLIPLLFLDGPRRSNGFRAAAIVLGILALRTVSTFMASEDAPSPDSPFLPHRRLWRRRRRSMAPARTAIDALVLGATERSGQFHHRLRPVLRDVAGERLQARHGLTIDDDRAADVLGPIAWDHLRRDRPAPDDRRSAGLDEATLRSIFDAVEAL